MKEEIIESKKELLKSLIKKESSKQEESTLKQFSHYIACNPEFKYNTTYLTDEIQNFIEDKKFFSERFKTYVDLIMKLHMSQNKKHTITVVINDVFKFNLTADLEFNESMHSEICNDNIGDYRFDLIGNKDLTIKFLHKTMQYITIETTHELKDKNRGLINEKIIELFKEFTNEIENIRSHEK